MSLFPYGHRDVDLTFLGFKRTKLKDQDDVSQCAGVSGV